MKFSIISTLKKAAVTGMLAGALFAASPALASAATVDETKPAETFSVVDRESMPKQLDRSVSSADQDSSTEAVFNCYYAQYPSEIFLDCVIYSGALQFVLYCSDGGIYYSPWFAGPAQWLIHGWCPAGTLLNYWGVNQI